MSNAPRFGFVIEYVKDIEKAKAFYTDVFGLEVQRVHPTFVQFDHFAIASDQPMGTTGEPELYWLVDDADAAFAELSKKGDVVTPLTQKPFGKVFSIRDAAGRPRYVLEFARVRPSQAV